jgi:TrbL/VirB6 plasmid conjugal transfer protein
MEFTFLDKALQDFLNTIETLWAPFFQMHGIDMLIGISLVAFTFYMIQAGVSGDIHTWIMGLMWTVLSLAVLRTFFLYSDQWGTEILNGFILWAQQLTGMSPGVLTPSGVVHQGLVLSGIFYAAGSHASWFYAPMSAVEIVICSAVVTIVFGIAGIIYLLAQIEVRALIVAASILLACAALPWTWDIFPGWGLTVLASILRIFFLLAVLAIGLALANGWARDMSTGTGHLADNLALMAQAAVESLLFLGCVYILPRWLAAGVRGATQTGTHIGEAVIAGIAASASGKVGSSAMNAPRNIGKGIEAGGSMLKTVWKMLMR